MKSEILFRGKRYDNYEWVYGYYANCGKPYGKTNYTYHFIIEYPGSPKDYHEVYTTTIGQYTGLKDKNGTKIFEGDFVKAIWWHSNNIDNVMGKIAFHDASFVLETPGLFLFFGDNVLEEDCEVIGNVLDNPELLEGE